MLVLQGKCCIVLMITKDRLAIKTPALLVEMAILNILGGSIAP